MSLYEEALARPAPRFLALRHAWRELRGGVSGFRIFLACIALGVAAITGISSFAQSLADGLAREGRVILGGDVAFTLVQRSASEAERGVLARHGIVSAVRTTRAMVRAADGRLGLIEAKAVDQAYPLYGTVRVEPAQDTASLFAEREGAFGAAVDPVLLARLDLKVGDRVSVGQATFELRAVLAGEPDKLSGGVGFGPRVLVSDAALDATKLIQPGSLFQAHYRLRIAGNDPGDAGVARVVEAVRAALPDAGWDIRTRSNASPQLGRNIERFTQFLTLVGLTALIVGGIGVASATRSHIDRKRGAIATMKALGASSRRIFATYLTQVLAIALVGTLLGLAIGAALPFALAAILGDSLPIPIAPGLQLRSLALGLGYGLLTSIAFTLLPLGRTHDIPVAALFRDDVAPARQRLRLRYWVAATIALAALAAFALASTYDRKMAGVFMASIAAVFVLLRLLAFAIMAVARRLPRPRNAIVRLALANMHRPDALTPSVTLSLGLGLGLLVTVALIDGNLRGQFTAALPERAPSFYFVDIQSTASEQFDAFIARQAPGAALDRVPMLRGRIVAANGTPADQLRPAPNAVWVLQSDRGITYAGDPPAGSRIVAGQWWPKDYAGPPLVSLERRIADGLGLRLGDTLTVNVLGRNITATIANFREVDWQSLGINFVLLYSPGTFRGAPHAHIATLTYRASANDAEEIALLKAAAARFPTVTIVRVKEAIEGVAKVVGQLVTAIRGASLVTVVAAILVLAGALASAHRHRVYDAVIMRTLGASRMQLLTAFGLEYAALGIVAAAFGVAAGSLAAWIVIAQVMDLSFAWLPLPAISAAGFALLVTVGFGLVGTWLALGEKPARVLRTL